MIIFLDIGAYHGQRMLEAIDIPIYDEIHCFEPSKDAFTILHKTIKELPLEQKERVKDFPLGLWNKAGAFPLHSSGLPGASLYHDKQQPHFGEKEECPFIRATDYLRELPSHAYFAIKLNCEGSECDIIDDLLTDPRVYGRILYIGIDFDCRKVRSQQHRAKETIRKLQLFNIPFAETSWLTCNRVKLLTDTFLKGHKQ